MHCISKDSCTLVVIFIESYIIVVYELIFKVLVAK
jgi:hypothetical protein